MSPAESDAPDALPMTSPIALIAQLGHPVRRGGRRAEDLSHCIRAVWPL